MSRFLGRSLQVGVFLGALLEMENLNQWRGKTGLKLPLEVLMFKVISWSYS